VLANEGKPARERLTLIRIFGLRALGLRQLRRGSPLRQGMACRTRGGDGGATYRWLCAGEPTSSTGRTDRADQRHDGPPGFTNSRINGHVDRNAVTPPGTSFWSRRDPSAGVVEEVSTSGEISKRARPQPYSSDTSHVTSHEAQAAREPLD
jgi:hypothetical protein